MGSLACCKNGLKIPSNECKIRKSNRILSSPADQ